MKKKIVRDISASTLQVFINQLAGVGIFYITSKCLDKSIFGEINWSVAFLVTIFNIFGCGIDQVIIRKIAANQEAEKTFRLFIAHTLLTGSFFYFLMLIGYWISPAFFDQHYLLAYLSISQVMVYLALPFKQNAIGREKFRLLMLMSTCSNVLRILSLLVLFLLDQLTIKTVVFTFITSSILEWLISILLTRLAIRSQVTPTFDRTAYRGLVKESLPQLGSVIFNSAVARFDWILLGALSTSVIMAEYSFAYKVFELSTLPLLILAPLILPKFIRIFKQEGDLLPRKKEILLLVRYEIIIACFIGLVLNVGWVYFIDAVTDGKYGAVNRMSILTLTCALPFLYINNILWSISFARGNLKLIFLIITVTFIVNVTGDIILIPYINAEGASLAYLLAIITQFVLYSKTTKLEFMRQIWVILTICLLCAVACIVLVTLFIDSVWIQLAVASIVYFVALVILGQVKLADRRTIKEITGI